MVEGAQRRRSSNRPRWQKVRRDLSPRRGRTLLVTMAVAVGVMAVGSIATALTVLDRELAANYQSANPASVILSVDNVDDSLVQAIESRPGVAAVEARREVTARMMDPGEGYVPTLLVVVDDFSNVSVDRFLPESGATAPGSTGMLVERSTRREVDLEVGDERLIKVGGAEPTLLEVEGFVSDPGRTPAWMTGSVIAYVTPEALSGLGVVSGSVELHVVSAETGDRSVNQELAQRLTAQVEAAGSFVTSVEVPVPGVHPSAGVMRTLLFLLQAFGVVALVAAGALVATVVSAMLRREARSIGLMKAMGAGPGQISGMYLVGVAGIGLIGTLIGIPVGLAAGSGFDSFAAGLLNIDITNASPAGWVIPLQLTVGVAVPLLAALVPISRAAASTVRAAIDESRPTPKVRVGRRRLLDPALALGVRNAWRVPGRTVLTVLALAVGGAAFMVALNTGVAWDAAVDAEFAETRAYQAEIGLDRAYPIEAVESALDGISEVESVEYWMSVIAQVKTGEGVGSRFPIYAIPTPTSMLSFPMEEGRALQPGETGSLVVTHLVNDPALPVGSTVSLDIGGTSSDWNVVGITRRLGAGEAGAGFVETLPPDVAPAGVTNRLIIASDYDVSSVIEAAEAGLDHAGIAVIATASADSGREALDDHLFILVGMLLAVAGLIAVVGGLGLLETIATGVLERRREIGVMRAIGAGTSTVMRVLMAEALALSLASWAVALVLSVPATLLVESITGMIFFEMPLETKFSSLGVWIWLAIVTVGAVVASGLPTLDIAEAPVRDALVTE